MSAIEEGKCAYTLGSDGSDNPYRKAKESMKAEEERYRQRFDTDYRIGLSVLLGRIQYNDARYQELMDLECQWDSGYAVAKRITVQKEEIA